MWLLNVKESTYSTGKHTRQLIIVHAKYTHHYRQSKLPIWCGVDQLLKSLIFHCAARITINIRTNKIYERKQKLICEFILHAWLMIILSYCG